MSIKVPAVDAVVAESMFIITTVNCDWRSEREVTDCTKEILFHFCFSRFVIFFRVKHSRVEFAVINHSAHCGVWVVSGGEWDGEWGLVNVPLG